MEQGTYEYLDSLAAAMQRAGNPPDVVRRGALLEKALRTGSPPIEYFLVRQPIAADNSELLDPTITRFTIAKP